ncbi:MAG TPA: porin family protein, partial [Polyangiaceae bacterium]
MSKKLVSWVVLGMGAALAAPAAAQEAKVGASADTSSGAQADASASPPPAEAKADAPPPAEAEGEKYEPYEPGYPPEHNLLEIGVFAGMLFPSKDHNLRDEPNEQVKYKNGPQYGGRLGYYPLSFLGLEGEAMLSLSRVRNHNQTTKAVLYSGRGSLVLQIPTGYVTPFVLGGAGKLAAIGTDMGKDSDTAWHFGLGAKIPLTHMLSLRVDGRDNLTAHTSGEGQAHTFEVNLGLTAVIERGRKEPPPPPADTDKDGVLDRDDKCPADSGTGPGGCPADTDADGVLDRDDYCPKEAGIAPKGCPDLDTDKDGILLPCDMCPDEVGVAPDGCKVKDTDKDGIFDDKDKCPKEPETKNGFEDTDGCPDKVP